MFSGVFFFIKTSCLTMDLTIMQAAKAFTLRTSMLAIMLRGRISLHITIISEIYLLTFYIPSFPTLTCSKKLNYIYYMTYIIAYDVYIYRAGLTIVPFVPWHGAPAAGGPPRPAH